MAQATFLDVAGLSFVGLLGVCAVLLVARTVRRALWYLVTWGLAFAVLSSCVSLLNAFPAYAVVRDALGGSLWRVAAPRVLGTAAADASAGQNTAADLYAAFGKELRRIAQDYMRGARDEL